MKILILNWRDPKHPLAGGAEQMVLEHAKFWKGKGAKITWFTSSFHGAIKNEEIDGIRYIRRGSHYTVFMWAYMYYVLGKLGTFDLIVDCFHFIPYFSQLYAPGVKKIAIIQEVAGKLWDENIIPPFSWVGRLIEPHIIRSYKDTPFITGSFSAKKDLERIGLKSKTISVIQHGFNRVAVKKFQKEKNPTLLFLGRVSKDKGIEDALMALELLARDYPDIAMWVVGKAESKGYEVKIKKMSKQFEVSKNCKWMGFVTQEKKFELLSRAWMLIHPSRKEGWGLNVIEANSVGTPAVGYAVGGLTDSIVDKSTGILVDPDPISMADGIEQLFKDKKLYQRISENAIAWSEKFNWDTSGKKSYKLIKKILEEA